MKFIDSFWKASFYKNKSNSHSFWRAFLRVIFVNFVIGIVYAVFFYGTLGKSIPQNLISLSEKAVAGYPQDLVVTIKDGALSKNIPGQLKLYKLSDFYTSSSTKDNGTMQYLISIDESQPVSLTAFASSSAVIFLGKDGWIAKGSNDMRINSYDSLKSVKSELKFSKDDLLYIVSKIHMYAGGVPLVMIIAIVTFFTVIVSLAQLVFILFVGLIVMLLSKWIIKRKTNYSEAYVLSLFALAPVIIIDTVVSCIPYLSDITSYIPFLKIILICAFLWFMFKESSFKKETNASVIL